MLLDHVDSSQISDLTLNCTGLAVLECSTTVCCPVITTAFDCDVVLYRMLYLDLTKIFTSSKLYAYPHLAQRVAMYGVVAVQLVLA